MTTGERIRALRNFLELNQTAFASLMGTSQNGVSLIENNRIFPTGEQLEALVTKTHVNREWLNDGTGEMFLVDSIPESHLTREQLDKIIAKAEHSAVPFFDCPVGDLRENCLPEYRIDFLPLNDVTFFRPIGDESMAPKFHTGNIIACKKASEIRFGETYLCIFHRNGELTELLRTIRKSGDSILLAPLNPDYDQITIQKSDIKALYSIKGRVELF